MKKLLLILFVMLSVTINAQLASGTVAPNFTATDINGNVHSLSDYLAAGKTIIMDISATWCGPCWNYHNSHALEDLYASYGYGGSEEVVVLFVEGDGTTGINDLNGLTASSQGNWVLNTPYPIIDSSTIASLYQISYFPTVYRICPNGIVTELQQPTTAGFVSSINSGCGALVGTQNNIEMLESESGFCTTNGSPIVKFKNLGANAVTSGTVNLKENGNVIATKNFTSSAAQFATASVTLDPININNSSQYSIEVENVNNAPNFNANSSSANLDLYVAAQTPLNIVVKVYTDNYPTEMTWKIKNAVGATVSSGGPYVGLANGGGADANTTKTKNVTLAANQCYSIQLLDSYGDGWGSGSTPHGLEVFANGVSIANVAVENFGTTYTKSNVMTTSVLGIDNFAANKTKVFPNPTAGIIHIITENEVNVTIVDVLGKTVYAANNITKNNSIDLSNLQKGIYFAKIEGDNASTTEKIILK
jgi:hypothetical protein